MEKISLMQKEIENKKILPKEIKDKVNSMIFYNSITTICAVLYICILNLIYLKASENIFDICTKIFSIVIVLITVVVFEIAYRKDCLKLCITGIEYIIYSIVILYTKYIFLYTENIYCALFMLIPLFAVIYNFVKTLIIYLKMCSDYKNNLSDIKELLVEKNEGYINEESTKTLRKKKELEEKEKFDKLKKMKNDKKENTKNKKTSNKKTNNNKKNTKSEKNDKTKNTKSKTVSKEKKSQTKKK